ncbi:MAG TPA: hypothetical protein QF901_03695, partial [Gammaproteobacteria bacterium]|nr:hypothetical protein [Gammaproteobacteria bacterium]
MKRLSSMVVISAAIIALALGLASIGKAQRNSSDFAALPQTVTTPADNQASEAKVELGKLLFWDPILSG